MLPLNGLGQEIFFHCWLFRHAWDQLVTDAGTDVCQQIRGFSTEVGAKSLLHYPRSAMSLCRRRMYSEDISGVVSLTKAFYLSAAGKLSRLRCKTEVVFICVDHSQELFLPLVLVSPQGRLILS